ncbi:hypothetical protein A2366_01810 [Candidatus Woesebacteria bacterium RIFOXYB1_FULL_33_9]|nr:MAG: hypothetical protein A2366_01810 [Candidatus Woesebacteria bacterium RIFOXYB1_FULL_33_9]
MSNKKIHITGMHCRSCEILIEEELKKIRGVTDVTVSHKEGIADISFIDKLNNIDVNTAVENAGYCVGENAKLPLISKNKKDYIELGLAYFIATALFLIAKKLGLFELAGSVKGSYSSLPVVFIISITAGISTCMALVGGLVLGMSSKFAKQNPEATGVEKFVPHVYFNLGRIISYFILGGIIGYAGSFFQLSTSILGILTVAVGLVMLLLGSQLIDIFPFLKSISFTLPKGIYKFLGIRNKENAEYSNSNASILGASTFFLPCGFTQAMQLYAISTGSPLQGALTLGVFALGTTPGLLGVGGLTSVVKGGFSKLFFKTAGVIVVLLSLFNVSNGLNLLGIKSVFAKNAPTSIDKNVKIVNGVQVVKMTQKTNGYTPNKFTIKKGVPVRWIITSESIYSCASSIVSQQLGIRSSLKLGENIFEFTPKEAGTIRFSCSMGMYTGSFVVVDDTGIVTPDTSIPAKAPSCGGSGGCGCGGGVKKNITPTTGEVLNVGKTQVLKASYSVSTDITPNKFNVKVGVPVKLEITVLENGQGCMGSVALPGLSEDVSGFIKDETVIFEFTPTKTGTFAITCAMGVPRGEIIVN